MDEKNGKVVSKFLIFVLALVIISSGVYGSYAYINYKADLNGSVVNSINTCHLNMNVYGENAISLLNAYPVSDKVGILNEPYRLTISKDDSNCSSISYVLSMKDPEHIYDSINPDLIKYQIVNTKTGEEFILNNPYKMNIEGVVTDEDITYEIRLWIDELATNNDLYVYNNDEIITNDDGTYKTKIFKASAVVTVSMK